MGKPKNTSRDREEAVQWNGIQQSCDQPRHLLKNRDITLPTKVCVVKAMVFPIFMYEFEIWTIKKTEHQRIVLLNCGVGEDS